LKFLSEFLPIPLASAGEIGYNILVYAISRREKPETTRGNDHMSASNKKKLRKEQNAVQLTEKQQAAQKEAQKTRLLTVAFVVCMAVLLVVAIVIGVRQTITAGGVMEKKTVALTLGDQKISNAELNYYYMDAINSFVSNYGSYAAMFGLDTTKPLNEQMYDADAETTWADYFMESAENNARSIYALCHAAEDAGYVLSDDAKSNIDVTLSNMNAYATLYGYSKASDYLQAIYGKGATEKSYREYCERNSLAQEYQQHYADSLSYSDADLRDKESENYDAYSSFSFNTYYLSTSRFLTGGTTDADGKTTYTDAEKDAAAKAAEAAANELAAGKYASVDALNEAIAGLSVNADTTASSTSSVNVLYSSVSSTYRDWVVDSTRKAGDITCIPSSTTSTDDNGQETVTVNGYYVVYFVGRDDNLEPLSNVRHILAAFEGGTTDSTTNTTTYSDEEKAAAKAEAEALLEEWKSGDATEDSFAALANEKSDDGNGTTGGLYEDISRDSNFVSEFKDWALEDHKPGDTGIVETQYGYHVMYYSGDTAYSYRDYQIKNALRSADMEQWLTDTVEALEMTVGSTKYLKTDLVLSSGN